VSRAIVALLFLTACKADPPQGSGGPTSTTTTSVMPSLMPSVTAAPTHAATVSDWTDANTPSPTELAAAPDRAAVLTFDAMRGGYIVQRAEKIEVLPRPWFGAGPPRRDVSISADGNHLAIPDGDAVVVYEVPAKRFLARLKAPEPSSKGKMSSDGKHVRWDTPGKPCAMTDITTKIRMVKEAGAAHVAAMIC